MQVSFSLQKFLFYVKRYEGWDRGARDREFWYTSSKFYNDIITTFTLAKRIGIRPLTFFRILSKFWDFWSRFCI